MRGLRFVCCLLAQGSACAVLAGDSASEAARGYGDGRLIMAQAGGQQDAKAVESGAPTSTGAEGYFYEPLFDWIHRAGRDYQQIIRRLSQPADRSSAGASKAPAKTTADTSDTGPKASQEKQAASRPEPQPGKDGTTEVQRPLAELRRKDAQPAEETRAAEVARKAEETKKAEEAKRAEEARIAAAKQGEDARKAEEAKKADEARRAEEARLAAAKQEEARKLEQAKKAEDTRKAEEAKRAEEARIAAAKQAEDARKAEEAKKADEARRAEEARLAAAKQEEARKAEQAKKADDTRKAEEAKRVEEARKAAQATAKVRTPEAVKEQAVPGVPQAAEIARAAESAAAAIRAAQRKIQREERKLQAATRAAETARKSAEAASDPAEKRAAHKLAAREARRAKVAARRAAAARRTRVAAALMVAPSQQPSKPHDKVSGPSNRGLVARREQDCTAAGDDVALPGWYVVRQGDTLWSIAARFYQAGGRYRLIRKANARSIASARLIYACQRIFLPRDPRRA